VARIPPDRVAIAESGVRTRAQGAAAELAGADAILVGSALMQAPIRRPSSRASWRGRSSRCAA
jgi:indole-3-glycerol phosphate synthase